VDEGGYGNRPQRRNIRREKDDKLHDSIIEERIQRERPCRTLFIRNIKASLTPSGPVILSFIAFCCHSTTCLFICVLRAAQLTVRFASAV
jgi:hypothetical protein